ncbi:MAG: hypothetical protein OXN89_23580 [Bryobacterales bacterium]|nr:hypothetical protein [Bryobacterales bacterium]
MLTGVRIENFKAWREADLHCQLSCVERLGSLRRYAVDAIGFDGEILDEYGRKLSYSGGPRVGDAFFKHVFNNLGHNDQMRRVPLTKSSDDGRGFDELPRNELDPSDRICLTVAVVAHAIILNATDSDWEEQKALVDTLGVKVEQVCPHPAVKGARER